MLMSALYMAKLEGAMWVIEFLLIKGVITTDSEEYRKLMEHVGSLSDPAAASTAAVKVRKNRPPRVQTEFEIKMEPLTRGLNAASKASLMKNLRGLAAEAKTVYAFLVEHVPQISEESPLAPLKVLEAFQLLDLAHALWLEDKDRDLERVLQDALALHQNNFVYPHVARPPPPPVEGGKKRAATKPSALPVLPPTTLPSIPLSDDEEAGSDVEAGSDAESDASGAVSRTPGKTVAR
jgi:hypothetical protein